MALFAGLLGTVLVLATTLGAALVERDNARLLVGRQLETLARSMADKLAIGMAERYREVGLLAGLESVRATAAREPRALRPLIENLRTTLPDYAWIGFVAPDGTVLAATGGVMEGLSVADQDWFTAGARAPYVAGTRTAATAPVALAGETPSPSRFADVAFPVRTESGALAGVLGAGLSWAWARDMHRSALDETARQHRVSLVVTTGDGTVIMGDGAFDPRWRRYHDLAGARPAGWFEDRGGETGPALFGFARSGALRDYPGLGWTVFARQDSATAFAPVRRALWWIAKIGAALAAAGLVLAWLLANRLTRPLHRLTAAARQLGSDPHATSLPNVGGSLEVTGLSVALRALLRRLGGVEQKLARATADAATPADERETGTDRLTGLPDREQFRARCAERLALARRHGHPISIALVDIDELARVNGAAGAAAGNEVIRMVGRLALQVTRETDIAARIEGEEFGVLVEGDEAAAAAYGERLRRQVEGFEALRVAGGVTVSIGCAALLPGEDDVENLVERADRALHAAKRSGGNRVTRAGLKTA